MLRFEFGGEPIYIIIRKYTNWVIKASIVKKTLV